MTSSIPSSRLIFVNTVEEKYKCASCKDLLEQPLQSSCGHRFCRKCLDKIIVCPKPVCPVDNEEILIDQTFPDKCAAKEISSLLCYCPNKLFGCNWTGTIAELEKDHQCSYEKISCQNEGCNERILRCQYPRHFEKECKYRKVQCMYCTSLVPEINLEKHFEQCPKYLLACVNGCGAKDIPREQMEEHKHLMCPLETKSCPFQHFGCDFMCMREQLENHLEDAQQKHLILAVEAAEKSYIKLQELEMKMCKLEETNRLLEGHVSNQEDALKSATDTLSAQQIKLNKVEQFVQKHTSLLENMSTQVSKERPRDTTSMNKMIQEFEKRIENFSLNLKSLQEDIFFQKTAPFDRSSARIVNQMESLLSFHKQSIEEQELRIKILNTTSFDGKFVWKIENYEQQFHDAAINRTKSIYSPPFYTRRFGYKLCARVYLNGDGTGRGTHMSLFICVMKGEYDPILAWPFTKKITLKLFNQSDGIHHSETFIPDPNSSSFQRPKSQMNIASGCPRFCSHAELHGNGNGQGKCQGNGFVKDNSVFIEVTVER